MHIAYKGENLQVLIKINSWAIKVPIVEETPATQKQFAQIWKHFK